MNALPERIADFATHACQLNRREPVLVGVSGGADSLCLLDALSRTGFTLIAAHFDHRLRPDSERDAQQVAERAAQLGLPFAAGEEDVAAYARTRQLSIEEAARTLRYRFLFEQARQRRAQAVAVGHTADDQVETVLMHFLRGAGLDGLKGMLPRTRLSEWDADLPLVRPLLEVWREETEAYCQGRGLQPVYDPTNLDPFFFRNRIRHQLIPALEKFNPRFRERIVRTARALAADLDVLRALTDAAWAECLLHLESGRLALARPTFLRHPPGIQRRLLRRALFTLQPGRRDVGFDAVERGIAFLQTGQLGQTCELLGGATVHLEEGRFWLVAPGIALPLDEWPQMPDKAPLLLDAPGRVALSAGWRLEAEWLPVGQQTPSVPMHEDPNHAWLDGERLALPLRVRARRPGDRFAPFGMDGHSLKLSDFLINVKMPRRARDGWPLVCSGEQIVWVPGYRPGHAFRVTPATRRILRLRLVRDAQGDRLAGR